MSLSYGLYVCIILETTQHRATFGIFCNVTQKSTPGENPQNVPYFFIDCTFFLWEGQGHFFGIRIKFHLGRANGRGKKGYGGEAQNEGYSCKIPIIKKDTNFL